MAWPPLTVLDFETTGVVPGYPNEPWQIGWIELVDEEPRAETLRGQWLRVGDRPFNRFAPGRHGQCRELLRNAPTLQDLWPDLSGHLLGRPLAAHHAATERAVLRRAFPLHRFGPWIDTLELSRHAWPSLPSHALEDVVAALGLTPSVEALCPGLEPHDACYDAAAAAVLLAHLRRQPAWRELSIEDLARLQRR